MTKITYSSDRTRRNDYIESIKKEITKNEKELEREEAKSIEDYSPSKAACLLNHIECLRFRMKFGRDKKADNFKILTQ